MLDPNYSDLLSAFLAHDVRFLVVGAYALGVHGRASNSSKRGPAGRVRSSAPMTAR